MILKPPKLIPIVLVTLSLCAVVVIYNLSSLARKVIVVLPGPESQSGSRNLVMPPAESIEGEPLQLFRSRPIGKHFETPPKISHVELIDLNRDELPDVLVCDCEANTVSWIEQQPDGEFTEHVLADNIVAAARAQCVDVDLDGDLDVLVAVLGKLFPSNDRIGSVVVLENTGREIFVRHDLLDSVPRVSDARAADLDGDMDLDLVITHFGYNEGELRWMENVGPWQYESHVLQTLAGGIHGIIADFNGDRAMDIVLLVSQQFEAIFIFFGDGKGNFRENKIYSSGNPDFGSAGIWLADLDLDKDLDVLYCNGDAFDYSPPRPWPWHGVQWLESIGGEKFRNHRLVDFGGAVNAQPADFDGDGDVDIFVSSAFNNWDTPQSQSLILLENVGKLQFVKHPLANAPSHLQALAVGDVNGDGRLDLVTGGMHISEPYDRVERVMLWLGNGNMPTTKPVRSTSAK